MKVFQAQIFVLKNFFNPDLENVQVFELFYSSISNFGTYNPQMIYLNLLDLLRSLKEETFNIKLRLLLNFCIILNSW